MVSISAAVACIVGFIEWLYLSIVENAITEACFSIIHSQANIASQYNPLYGVLINLIPVIITVVPLYAGLRKIDL